MTAEDIELDELNRIIKKAIKFSRFSLHAQDPWVQGALHEKSYLFIDFYEKYFKAIKLLQLCRYIIKGFVKCAAYGQFSHHLSGTDSQQNQGG